VLPLCARRLGTLNNKKKEFLLM